MHAYPVNMPELGQYWADAGNIGPVQGCGGVINT